MSTKLRYKVSPNFPNQLKSIDLGCGENKIRETTYSYLGKLIEQGSSKNVNLSMQNESVTGIFGQRGSGKSYTLGSIIESLAATDTNSTIGHNLKDRSVLVIDTLNIFQYSFLEVSKIADPSIREKLSKSLSSFGVEELDLNIKISYPKGYKSEFYPDFYEEFSIDTSLILPEDYGHIFNIDIYKDPMGQLLLYAYDAIKYTGYRHNGNTVPGSLDYGINEMVNFLSEQENTEEIFNPTTVRALSTRLITLLRNPLFSSSGISLNKLLSPGTVRILLFGQLSPPIRSVIAALLTRQIFKKRAEASEAEKMLKLNSSLKSDKSLAAKSILEESPSRTLICIDEAQGYAPPTKDNPCTGVLIQYVKEGRNHGLSLMVTSQQPSALHSELMSQLDCIISHRLTVGADIDAVIKNSKGRPPDSITSGAHTLSESSVLRELSQGQALVTHINSLRSFLMTIRSRVTAHGGIEV